MKRNFLMLTMVFALVLLFVASCTRPTTSETVDLYAGIPDKGFPIPMLNDAPIPYEYVTPPEEGWNVTSYVYSFSGSSFMESYKEQLKNAGFVEQESPEHIESLWRYDRESDGLALIVEMFHEESKFNINMYVNKL